MPASASGTKPRSPARSRLTPRLLVQCLEASCSIRYTFIARGATGGFFRRCLFRLENSRVDRVFLVRRRTFRGLVLNMSETKGSSRTQLHPPSHQSINSSVARQPHPTL